MKNNPTNYLIQLDGLRCIAVLLVLIDHWSAAVNTIPFGPLGVTIFFVLSGFLITRILLVSKEKYKEQPGGLRKYWTKFFIRRTLRIFPVYYLSLAVLFVFNVPPVREKLAWCVLYATNIYIAIHQQWLGVIDHLWSLAVEEQYYLFFPFVIFFIPRRYLVHALIGFIVLSIALRGYFFYAGFDWVVPYVSTPACLDAFGLGGLLAYGQLYRQETFEKIAKNTIWIWLGLILWIVNVYWAKTYMEIHNPANVIWERWTGSLFAVFLIGKGIVGFKGTMKRILESPVALYFGKISYGLYVYHNFIYNHYHTPATHPTLRILNKIYSFFPVLKGVMVFELFYFFLLTILLATVSWYIVEKPINSLKERFT
jgi:peptidoglycan/LPS O-acetylase OafA/YrhL